MIHKLQQDLDLFLQECIRYLYRLIALFLPHDGHESEPNHKLGWWVEVFTQEPPCLYYFGAFDTLSEAEDSKHGYVQDLIEEGSKGIKFELQMCQPKRLTVDFN
jgi:Domain of unknown function (DUF1816)